MKNFEINPLERYTTIFKALSELTRLKIMWLLLSIDSKISVSEIIDVLEESQYNVSKHLKILKNAGLIHEKKEGKWSFYYYLPSEALFDKYVKETVMAIPKDLMTKEIIRCEKRLSMRVDGKCIIGAESDEWAELKND
ncbi:ArsR family transcriptional regulator [Halolactibacillus halophilus]|uniref:Transcriptional regulator n=1 Tax=Halolactibacillus halophilus TaxID=306540 RepID=A0A1I5RKP5_9BACI|nr:metalloregulator ArsR/SmtB family transcription factor [Halolactibacillus halophilus]GEM02915.1 transcriptional regulator [Halolactibacillus halophilus]SFP59129.1 ArsR family transcriptional regulator [Halolactibacillus halophilus]